MSEGAQREEARQADRAAARRSPEAAAARQRSRAAHGGLGRDDALALARTKFPHFLERPVPAALALPPGARVKEYLDPNWTQIEDADGKTGVVYSPLPTLAGNGEPVDLALVEASDGFRSQNPLVPVGFGRGSRAGARLERTGIGVLPSGDDVTALRSGDRLFYSGVATDTDAVLAPTPAGFQLLWQLRSAQAPTLLRARFDLPEGAELRLAHDFVSEVTAPVRRGEDEMVGAEVVKDGKRLAFVAPPATFDADGERVPTRYEVSGDTLEVHVAHGGRDLAYPLLVDPEVGDGWNDQELGASSAWFSTEDRRGGQHAFSFARNYQRYGLQVGAYQWATYNDAATAGWSWQSPDGAYIRNVTFNSMRHVADSSSLITGIYRPGVWEAGPGWYGYSFDGYGWYHATGSPTERNLLFMGLYMHGSFQRLGGAFAHLSSVSATLGDGYAPTMQLRAPTPPSNWTNYHWQAIGYDMWDRGLGLKAAAITRVGDGRAASVIVNQTCTGGRQPCPLYHNTDGMFLEGFSRQLPYDLNALGEGTHQMHVHAQDVAGNISYSTPWTVRYDKTAPQPGEISFDTPSENSAELSWDPAVDPAAADGTASGVSAYKVRWRAGTGSFGAWTTYGATTFQSAVTPTYPSGTSIEFQLTAVDAAGNESAPVSIVEQVDGDGPEIGAEQASGVFGGYVGPNAPSLTVSAEDAGSGVRRLTVESPSGSVLASADAGCTTTCPATFSRALSVNLASYGEGPFEIVANSTDGLNNRGIAQDLEFVMDRTAPPALTKIRQMGAGGGGMTVTWTEAPDPAISETLPGSGKGHVRYRYNRNDGGFSGWGIAQETAYIPAAALDRVTVEAQLVDAVGNASAVSTADIVMLPDALVTDDPQMTVDAVETSQQRPTIQVELADEASVDPEEAGESDAQSSSQAAGEEQRATAAQGGPVPSSCTPNIDSVVSRDVWANPRTFYPERTRLGARMFIMCNALPSGTTRVTLSGAFAFRMNPGETDPRKYKEIGRRHVVDLGLPRTGVRATYFNGIRNFCIPRVGGRRNYVVTGVIKYYRDGGRADVEQTYNTDFNNEKSLVCPDAAERRFREAAAFSQLGRYNADPFVVGSKPAYRWLRGELGPQPYVPPAVKRDAWNAHHVIPVNDRLARTIRALAFRCRIHPNHVENGVYLRGSGLREKRGGRRTKAFKQLVAYDNAHGTTLHKRTYHPDTYRNNYGYIDRLTSNARYALQDAPESCATSPRETLRNVLSAARANLRAGSFGVEQPGH